MNQQANQDLDREAREENVPPCLQRSTCKNGKELEIEPIDETAGELRLEIDDEYMEEK